MQEGGEIGLYFKSVAKVLQQLYLIGWLKTCVWFELVGPSCWSINFLTNDLGEHRMPWPWRRYKIGGANLVQWKEWFKGMIWKKRQHKIPFTKRQVLSKCPLSNVTLTPPLFFKTNLK